MTTDEPIADESRRCLDPAAVLKNIADFEAPWDFAVTLPVRCPDPAMRLAPGSLESFLGRIDELRDGAVVYVRTNLLAGFFATAFPLIRTRVVLVSAGSDWSGPGIHRHALDNPKLIRWFGENCDLAGPHPKFEPMPIGFAARGHAHGNQAALLRLHVRMPPVAERPLQAHASFHFNMSHRERRRALAEIRDRPGITIEPHRVPPELLWIRHANHAFVISPHGGGPDCHRTWEALLLGSIPIVKISSLNWLHRQFPIVMVADWREITPAAMASWRDRLEGQFTLDMFHRLTCEHWVARIRAAAQNGA
jgi:hypothetical protein